MNEIKINALLIAAGKSGRIGIQKALLPYQEQSFISCILKKLFPNFQRIVVVVGYEAEKVKLELEPFRELASKIGNQKLTVVENINYEFGMFSSIKLGLMMLKDADFVLLHMIDQPDLPENFYLEMKQQVKKSVDWIQPIYNNKNGHPIIFGKKVLEKILSSDLNSDLRKIKKELELKVFNWNCRYKEILTDIDTLDDYNNLFSNSQV